ncbi:MAG: tetratricopeptide repeat protein, partial [Candidatus Eremiobacterota bacterium]
RSRLQANVYRSLAQVYTRLGRLDDASSALEKVAELDSDSLEGAYSRIALAGLLERTRGPEASERLLRSSIEDAPTFASLFLQTLGELQTRAGAYDEAERSLEQAITRLMVEATLSAPGLSPDKLLGENPRFLSLMLARCELDMARGNLEGARETLERLRDHAPTHPLVNLAWAGYYERQGDDHTAVAYLERAVAHQQASSSLLHELTRPAARARLAECYTRLERLDDAEAEYRRALKSGDRHPHLLASLAYLLSATGRAPDGVPLLDEAAEEFHHRLQRNPSDGELLLGLGSLMAFREQFAEARPHLERATRVNPRDSGAWSALGDLERRTGNSDAARRCYERALELAARPGQVSALKARLEEVSAAP